MMLNNLLREINGVYHHIMISVFHKDCLYTDILLIHVPFSQTKDMHEHQAQRCTTRSNMYRTRKI